MAEAVIDRRHKIFKVYSCSGAGDDVLMFGDITMWFETGTEVTIAFCARGVTDLTAADGPKIKILAGLVCMWHFNTQ